MRIDQRLGGLQFCARFLVAQQQDLSGCGAQLIIHIAHRFTEDGKLLDGAVCGSQVDFLFVQYPVNGNLFCGGCQFLQGDREPPGNVEADQQRKYNGQAGDPYKHFLECFEGLVNGTLWLQKDYIPVIGVYRFQGDQHMFAVFIF